MYNSLKIISSVVVPYGTGTDSTVSVSDRNPRTICNREVVNENPEDFLEQPNWSQNNSFLGSCLRLEHSSCVADTQKPPEMISGKMTGVMCGYSAVFMRFAWMVQPRNLHLLVLHASNETVQLYQLYRFLNAQGYSQNQEEEEAAETK
ncbi:hypothetical protein Q3G72_017770 [Acer saccharum]|nr:hypothetical protein Q3G72_017770 [Acer saccharum]